MAELAGFCDICKCSTDFLAQRTSGDVQIRICKCPKCGIVKVEKWRKVQSYVSSLKIKDPEKMLKIAEGV